MKCCCLLVILPFFFCTRSFSQVTVGFSVPSTTCLNDPVAVLNTSTGASNYYWSFCAADFNSTPEAISLGNPSGVLNMPVFGCYVQDADGNFYGLVDCHLEGHLIRLSFGNSLLNTPTGEDLGTFGGLLPTQLEGIQLIKVKGNWTAILVGGGYSGPNSDPRIVKVDFGSALKNTPTATNWGNIGGLNLPLELFVGSEGGNYYGFTVNANSSTITRFSFGPDFTNPPTGLNLGNIGNFVYPDGLTFVKYTGSWYCMVTNGQGNTLTRLDFGSSLLNTPTGVNIGNPGGTMNGPRDIALFTTCSGVFGFVVNANVSNMIKLNFGNDPTSVPTATDLGNLGNFNFPHSLSDFFQVGNDIYSFIPDVNSNTITRIRFLGCSDIPGSNLKNPPPVTYTKPGVYNINLLVDLGLPTQSSYCQEVTVFELPQGKIAGDTVCLGNSPALLYTGLAGTAPYLIGFTDGTNTYTQGGLAASSGVPLPYPLTAPGTTTFKLTTIRDANGCSADTSVVTDLMVAPLPQGGLTGTTTCGSDSAQIVFTASSGTGPYALTFSSGGTAINDAGVASGVAFAAPLPSTPTTYDLISITDRYGCPRTGSFDDGEVKVTPLPVPVLQFAPLGTVCFNNGSEMITAATETSGMPGAGAYSGPGIDATGNFSPSDAGNGVHTIVYTYTADNGCTTADSSQIQVNPVPPRASELIIGCDGIPARLSVPAGGASYTWNPSTGLSDPNAADPTTTVDMSTTYFVLVVDSDGCSTTDTITFKELGSIKNAFVIPNAFTPNGDGHNDCFGVHAWGSVILDELDIFDRWGARVFSTTNPADCWDGTYNGRIEPPGAYVFVIKAETACGKVTRTGTLMLIR
jgi:gliding motility-associated-like protein